MFRILAADIGATHCRFALFSSGSEATGTALLRLEGELWFTGAEHATFRDVLVALLAHKESLYAPLASCSGIAVDIAVLAPAGPVQEGRCVMSNLDWIIDAGEARQVLGLDTVLLINDFAAQAYACCLPESVDAVAVFPGTAQAGFPMGVIGAGTGLGKSLILDSPSAPNDSGPGASRGIRRPFRARILPSEGGHEEFPFVGTEEFAFAAFAAQRAGTERLIGDNIVTGSGLAHLFAFHTGLDVTPPEATARIQESPETLAWFARFYARSCRNYILDTLALGGLYITGGMALRLPVLEHPAFAEEFLASPTQKRLLVDVPVGHVRSPQAGLFGAALHGRLRLAAGIEAS